MKGFLQSPRPAAKDSNIQGFTDPIQTIEVDEDCSTKVYDSVHFEGTEVELGPGIHDIRTLQLENKINSIKVARLQ